MALCLCFIYLSPYISPARPGVCDVGSCQAACLADYFTLEEGRVSAATNACSGYTALIAGVCTDVCDEDEGEDPAAFQEVRNQLLLERSKYRSSEFFVFVVPGG